MSSTAAGAVTTANSVTTEKSATEPGGFTVDDGVPDHTVLNRFKRLREKVLEKRPVLREIIQEQGAKNLYAYAKEYADVNINQPILERQEEFLIIFKQEVAKRLGMEVATSATEQLRRYYFVSTADHHGPICHPFFLNANLISSVPYFERSDPYLQNVIVLSNANVSLNNSSFPRGLIFHSNAKGVTKLHRLAFSTCANRLCPVFNFPAYTAKDIERVLKNVKDKAAAGDIRTGEADTLSSMIQEVYNLPDVIDSEGYSDQITKTNFHLWKKFFIPNHRNAPNLVYLEQEGLVAQLLLAFHVDGDTTISRMMFDPAYEQLMTTHFEDIMGAFSRKTQYGTYLFWALPPGAKYRIQLWKQGNELVAEDGSYRVELTPHAVRRALEKKELISSMLLAYTVLSFYYGLKCLGGFSQVNYLTYMKNAYIRMQLDLGGYKSIEVCARAQTKELGGDMTIAFLGDTAGTLTPATGLDLILYGTHNTWPVLVDQSKQITLEEALNPLMPEFYRIIYPELEREPDLSSLTARDITALTHLDSKIKACAFLPNA
ncbi:MAG: hypothetical protein WC289_04285 [Patescibacteria group bacterium]